jgi:hypothetical protein
MAYTELAPIIAIIAGSRKTCSDTNIEQHFFLKCKMPLTFHDLLVSDNGTGMEGINSSNGQEKRL